MANIVSSKKEARRVYNDTHTKSDSSFAKAYREQKQFARKHGATGSAVRAFARASVNNAPATPMQPVINNTPQGLAISAAPITPARVLAEQTAAQATPAIGRVETSPASMVAVPTFKPLARIDEEHDAKMREKQAWAAKNPISAMQEDLIAKGYTLRGRNNGVDGIFGNSTYLALGEALKDKEWADAHPEYANMYAQHTADLKSRKSSNTTTTKPKNSVQKTDAKESDVVKSASETVEKSESAPESIVGPMPRDTKDDAYWMPAGYSELPFYVQKVRTNVTNNPGPLYGHSGRQGLIHDGKPTDIGTYDRESGSFISNSYPKSIRWEAPINNSTMPNNTIVYMNSPFESKGK